MVEVPADVLAGPADGAIPEYVERELPEADAREVARAVSLLRSAARPLLLADDGVLHAGAWGELAALAERLEAPVVTTIQGKSGIAEEHPWSLGDMNSLAGQAAYPLADAVFAVGCRFAQTDTRWPWFTPPPRLVHLDADPTEVGRLYLPEVSLVGDTRTVLQQMLAILSRNEERGMRNEEDASRSSFLVPHSSSWVPYLEDLRRQHRDRPRLPLLAALRRALPPDAVVAFDVCVPGYRSRWEWPIIEPRSYYYPGVYVGMGYGLPAAIGARIALGRPTVAVCGDGSFQMTMAELGTALQSEIAVVVVIINDAGLTLIRHIQDREYAGRRYAVDLRNPDFTALVRAYGIAAERVETAEAAGEAVARALARGGAAVIELLQEKA
jgi:acetolactate synthase-1/2/3 large subunit